MLPHNGRRLDDCFILNMSDLVSRVRDGLKLLRNGLRVRVYLDLSISLSCLLGMVDTHMAHMLNYVGCWCEIGIMVREVDPMNKLVFRGRVTVDWKRRMWVRLRVYILVYNLTCRVDIPRESLPCILLSCRRTYTSRIMDSILATVDWRAVTSLGIVPRVSTEKVVIGPSGGFFGRENRLIGLPTFSQILNDNILVSLNLVDSSIDGAYGLSGDTGAGMQILVIIFRTLNRSVNGRRIRFGDTRLWV